MAGVGRIAYILINQNRRDIYNIFPPQWRNEDIANIQYWGPALECAVQLAKIPIRSEPLTDNGPMKWIKSWRDPKCQTQYTAELVQ